MSTKFEDMDQRGPEHCMNHLDIERSSLAQADAEEDRRNLMDRIQQLVDELTNAPRRAENKRRIFHGKNHRKAIFLNGETIEKPSFQSHLSKWIGLRENV